MCDHDRARSGTSTKDDNTGSQWHRSSTGRQEFDGTRKNGPGRLKLGPALNDFRIWCISEKPRERSERGLRVVPNYIKPLSTPAALQSTTPHIARIRTLRTFPCFIFSNVVVAEPGHGLSITD
jgi:hypothetical protein